LILLVESLHFHVVLRNSGIVLELTGAVDVQVVLVGVHRAVVAVVP